MAVGGTVSYHDNPRTCSNCGVNLYPNFSDVGWDHRDKNFKPYDNGCKFDGLFACAGKCLCPANAEMLGPFRAELVEAHSGGDAMANESGLTDAEKFVRSKYPDASCFETNLYWPGQGERRRFIVIKSGFSSISEGEGITAIEAWANAANRIEAKERIYGRK
jgi:hypothetical protein